LMLAVITWRRRPAPGAWFFSAFNYAIFLWACTWMLEIGAVDIPAKILWAKLEYVGILASTPLWLLFALAFTGKLQLNPIKWILLWTIPAISLGMVFTNELHGLFWTNVYFVSEPIGRVTVWEHGIWFWISASYQYFLIMYGISVLWLHNFKNTGIYRKQVFALTIGALIPIIINVLYILRIPVLNGLDFTPLSISFAGIIYVLAVFRYHLLDITVVARNTLVEKVPDGILVLNSEGIIIDMNPATEQMLKINKSADIGKGLSQVWPNLTKVKKELYSNKHLELPAEASGNPIDLDIRMTCIQDKKKGEVGQLLMLRDITQRRKLERVIHESEKRYSTLVEHSNDGVLMIQDRTYIFVNQAICKTTGYSVEEWVGQKLPFPLNSNFAAVVAERNRQRNEGFAVPNNYDLKLKCKDGREISVEVSVALISYQEKPAQLVTVRDVTERRRMEQIIIDSEKRYSTLVEQSNDGVLIVKQGIIQFTNQTFTNISGYSKDELHGQRTLLVLTEQDAYLLRDTSKMIQSGIPVPESLEIKLKRKDGQIRDVDVALGPITFEGESVTIVTVRDITDKKITQKKLETLYNEEKDLRSNLQEEISNRSKYTRALVHELKTPLTAILSSSELLESEIHDGIYSSVVKNIREASLNLEHRTNELIDLARGEIGMLKSECEPLDITRLIRETYRKTIPIAKSKGLELVTDIADLPLVMGDRNLLKEVLSILLNNAIKYTAKGQIEIRAKDFDTNALLVQVLDTGKGIDQDQMNDLFDPFRRKISEGMKFSGIGVGLALCKIYIELQKGKIWVESTPGVGTTFFFTIPVYKENQMGHVGEQSKHIHE
jgi:PAS domain S-box-containing protein